MDYTITFSIPSEVKQSEREKINMRKEIASYFKRKASKWLNVLRSIVGGHDRELKLNFTVEDKTSPETKTYSRRHSNPSNIKIEQEGFSLED